ncbi:MAG: hypothetical protein F4Y39_18145 [Gemmatimonadetes bacterium]|nr:hypothetical protein [Gemmatimonadota bacterium]MYC15649.1 hypothetical protein [Gemmatimonadota bacterium]MYD59791.1 hypothetical protein [Gemmatimonadota bacterium]MYF71907.1 hypothetical protein [Gemmatimonadota bacterium]MYK52097.1 hypothetical protein [Gemmatimonadota bacterium]
MDADIKSWRERPLEQAYPYLIIDATYLHIRVRPIANKLDRRGLQCPVATPGRLHQTAHIDLHHSKSESPVDLSVRSDFEAMHHSIDCQQAKVQ